MQYQHNPYAFASYNTEGVYPHFTPVVYVPPCRARSEPQQHAFTMAPQVRTVGNTWEAPKRRGPVKRTPPSVCLDYLKGVCNDKRYKCKFAHPPLPAVNDQTPLPSAKQDVCDVWVLTGFCKFGAKCKHFHPVLDDAAVTCAPAITAKMARKKKCKKVKEVNQKEQTEDSDEKTATPPSSPLHATGPAQDLATIFRRVNGILNKITPEKFGQLAEQLQALIAGDVDLLSRVLPLIFAKGCAESQMGEVYARLCRHLYLQLAVSDQAIFTATIAQLGNRLLFVDEVLAQLEDEEQLAKLNLKRLGSVRFMGQLHIAGLLPVNHVLTVLDFLAARCGGSKEATFHAELLCKLLATVGKNLDEAKLDTFRYYTSLQQVSRDETRVRVLIQNLLELRYDGWVPRREEEKARTLAEMEAATRF
eukprot:TRINITY_DN397_c0_g1_i1.p1 TRINITY_DN397_c0_g1~~TRINITY_DN397_c0_g1_i1.p1  ORF type:complete len:418 (-),score=55.98 TRINITY_DN397_c0_g1_i1:253-1506(-)